MRIKTIPNSRFILLYTNMLHAEGHYTFVRVSNESLIDMLLLGVFQDVEETQVDSVRLFHDEVQQRLSSFDWTISQKLN